MDYKVAPLHKIQTIAGMGAVVVYDGTHFLVLHPDGALTIWTAGYDEVVCPKNWVLV